MNTATSLARRSCRAADRSDSTPAASRLTRVRQPMRRKGEIVTAQGQRDEQRQVRPATDRRSAPGCGQRRSRSPQVEQDSRTGFQVEFASARANQHAGRRGPARSTSPAASAPGSSMPSRRRGGRLPGAPRSTTTARPRPRATSCVCVFNTESCTIFGLDAVSGEMKWSWFLGNPLTWAPTIADGRVFAAYPAQGPPREGPLPPGRIACSPRSTRPGRSCGSGGWTATYVVARRGR